MLRLTWGAIGMLVVIGGFAINLTWYAFAGIGIIALIFMMRQRIDRSISWCRDQFTVDETDEQLPQEFPNYVKRLTLQCHFASLLEECPKYETESPDKSVAFVVERLSSLAYIQEYVIELCYQEFYCVAEDGDGNVSLIHTRIYKFASDMSEINVHDEKYLVQTGNKNKKILHRLDTKQRYFTDENLAEIEVGLNTPVVPRVSAIM